MLIPNTLELNKDNVLKIITPDEIFRHYLGSKFKYNKAFSSPFRTDHKPSFIISDKTYQYTDFATGERGDVFNFVQNLYNINFFSSLKQIVYDLNKDSYFNIITRSYSNSKTASVRNMSTSSNTRSGPIDVKVKRRKFNKDDYNYWNSYGISNKYLKLGRITAISHFFINDKCYVAEKYAYAFIEQKDSIVTIKVYQPFSKSLKWINGNNFSVWELWYLLPDKHDKLIITSSRKDSLSIIENLKIPTTSFQAETVLPKKQVIDDIKSRFKTVYLLYDNDYTKTTNWGQKNAKKLIDEYNFINLVIPEYYKSKDFSDLVFNTSRVEASLILKNLINDKS